MLRHSSAKYFLKYHSLIPFGFFGNRRNDPQHLVVSTCENFIAFQIEPDAAEEVPQIDEPKAAAFDHFDLVVETFDPARRESADEVVSDLIHPVLECA